MNRVSLILVFAMAACFLCGSAFAGKAADWPMGAAGYVKYLVIDGTVKEIDEKSYCLFIEGSDILGDEPLCVGDSAMIYKGSEETCLKDIRGAAMFSLDDRVSFSAFKDGDRVKATYSIVDGKYIAETLCHIK